MKPGLWLGTAWLLTTACESWGQADSARDSDYPKVLEEVIVTAQKIGEQNLLDVPLSVTAIGEDELAKRSIKGMDDYLRYLPGTNFIDRGTGRNSVIIRGITSDPGRGGVITGVYIDEIPIQGLGLFETGSPDLGLVDVERVEVLRGPQGTLYGAGSMSGTVRTLTRPPELNAFGGYVKFGGGVTSGYGDFNNDAQAVVNIPLAEGRFALRAVAYRFDDSGYVRNVAYRDPAKLAGAEFFHARFSAKVDDRGARVIEGYRLGALWRVTDRLDIRFTAIGQQTDQDGIPTIDVRQGPYEQSRFARLDGSDENLSDDLELYGLTIRYSADDWSLISASAWTRYKAEINYDVGVFFLNDLEYLQSVYGFPTEPPDWIYQSDDNDVFTQEVRWSWNAAGRWRGLVGAFYEERDYASVDSNHFEGFPDPYGGFFEFPTTPYLSHSRQTSLFADLTVGLVKQLEATAGLRRYDIRGGGFYSTPDNHQSGNTLKAGLNWRPGTAAVGEDGLIYALWAEGFRPGFEIGAPAPRCDPNGDGIIDEVGLPWENVKFDDVSSIEVGYKGYFAERRVAVEAAAFKIDWSGIRVDVVVPAPCASTLPFNAGDAESKGFEFTLSAVLTDRLQLNASASWMRAELSKDGLLGPAGSRLPGSPDFNASLGLEYSFAVGGHDAWARGDAAWVGDYYNTLQETPPRLGDYSTISLSGGVGLGDWSLEIYVNNLTDSDALTWANPIWAPYDRESRLRPRTIGVRLGYRFGVD